LTFCLRHLTESGLVSPTRSPTPTIATVDIYFDDLKIVTENLGARLVPAQPVR